MELNIVDRASDSTIGRTLKKTSLSPDQQTLINEIAAWQQDRNANHAKADWQFTTPEARIRLKHLYPSI